MLWRTNAKIEIGLDDTLFQKFMHKTNIIWERKLIIHLVENNCLGKGEVVLFL